MIEKTVVRYIITDRWTGRRLARGSSVECAERLGLTYGSFLTMVCRAGQGRTPYCVEREIPSWKQEFVQKWEESFGWYRAEKIPYPCTGCMNVTYCDHTGEYCKAFARWFAANYTQSARRIKIMTGGAGND